LAATEAVAEVVELTYGEAIDNLVSVTTDLADPLRLVRGDRVQLQQVMLNLVINAIEAMSAIEVPSLHFGVCLRLSLLSGKGCRQRKT
jgi:C4-dicarboxylate-specific signal transduction histidine kinase